MEKYNSLVIVGAQWGDEGKGKMTDYFAQKADVVVRFSGGDNAGHVINFNGEKHKVTLVPSGIFNKKTTNVIGNGCVINLRNLINEISIIEKQSKEYGNLIISNKAHILMPYHIEIDKAIEEERKSLKIGTTKKGIGPAYSDKISRMGIRLCDIARPDFKSELEVAYNYNVKFLKRMFDINFKISLEEIYNELQECYLILKHRITDCEIFVENAIKDNKNVLFEGAQGALLDIDHGTYPYVTSSNTSANNASIGTGISHKLIQKTLGIVKAYCTRVGEGPFPSELNNEIGENIRRVGNEYGSNTGRPRRVGWFDAVALKHAIRTSGLDSIFITLLDVLTGIDNINICVGYEHNGTKNSNMPANARDLAECTPIYVSTPGWKQDITKVNSFVELPDEAKNYIKLIEKICEIKVDGFSVGPDRKQTILYEEFF
ncbi:adenylosuccinate synthase [Spiroplasma turonicum]|uniref:Adenylosuccinate synthetase n=1 Tax=Spiroplasma turonicum TaxID=216946 RepID=A0A0K1P7N8_9MOLU|nr:adenylosuccinate synthase [Spiroplasma turonicum]AKU80313.1 adenylosuccinate synthetase [Spiroplasma turonicum]ALX71314.1 adenylosuccinate synthetase [Spiroplasma turonicum]